MSEPDRPRSEPSLQLRHDGPVLTFRDPAGQLRLTEKFALRQIRPAAVEETEAFLTSPLRAALERRGDLIASEIASPADFSFIAPNELWLAHPRIEPITYPWEWTPAQWRAAAELTLEIAKQAVGAGWTLKDATPLNILFNGAQPMLVDVLSFERRDPRSSVWLAYGQFVRTFLLPLVAAKHLGWPLEATFFARDGYEPSQIYAALMPWQRLSPDLFDVVALATLLGRTSPKKREPAKPASTTDPDLAAHILRKRMVRLGKQIGRTARAYNGSEWSGYSRAATHYQPGDAVEKRDFVRNVLQRCGPARVLDIGANTGTYSQIVVEAGAKVVALDADAAALEELWTTASRRSLPITVMVANIARPTPAAGWRNSEQLSLLDRLAGKFDMVLMLAVIHHLILREQVPLAQIAELCAALTTRWLILEWVPTSDAMYQEWLRGRDALYGHFTEDDLRNAFSTFFAVRDRCKLGNKRVLFLLERVVEGNRETLHSSGVEARVA